MVGDADPAGADGAHWSDVTDEFRLLGGRLRTFYDQNGDDATGDIREAAEDLAGAAQRLGRAVAGALHDPGVQEQAKHTLVSIVSAVSATIDRVRADVAPTDEPEDPA